MQYYKYTIFITLVTICLFLRGMEKQVVNPLQTLNNKSRVKLEDRTLYLYLNLTPLQSTHDAESAFTTFCERFRGKKNLQGVYNSEPVDEILKAYSILSTPEFKEHYDKNNHDLAKFYGKEHLDLYAPFNTLEKILQDEDTAYNAPIKNPAAKRPFRPLSSELTTDQQLLNSYLEITQKFSPYRFPEGSTTFIQAEKTIDEVKESYAFLGESDTRKVYDKNNNKRSFLVALKMNAALERLKEVVNSELPSQERLSPQPTRSLSLKIVPKKSPESEKRNSLTTVVKETVHHLVTTRGLKLAKRPEIVETSFQQPIKCIETADSPKNHEKEL